MDPGSIPCAGLAQGERVRSALYPHELCGGWIHTVLGHFLMDYARLRPAPASADSLPANPSAPPTAATARSSTAL